MLLQEKISHSFADFSLVKDKLICIDYLTEEPLNVDKGIQMVEAIRKLGNNQPCVVIHNVGDRYIFTTDALRFMGSQLNADEHSFLARAIVTNNPAARLASDNFIKLYKPVVPTKLFYELKDALTWADEVIASKK